MKSKKQPQTTNISSDELTCNSYNTTEEEEDETKKDSLYKIQLRKEKMNKFFIENPYLEGQIDLNSNDVYINKDIYPGKIGQTFFLEDLDQNDKNKNVDNTHKFWDKISKEVDSTFNIKKKTKAKTLDQIMKRINIFKSRLDTLDRNPILKKILERDSYEDSEIEREKEEEKKKKKAKEEEEFVFYSFKKKMQQEYKTLANKKKMRRKPKKDGNKSNSQGLRRRPKVVSREKTKTDMNTLTSKSKKRIPGDRMGIKRPKIKEPAVSYHQKSKVNRISREKTDQKSLASRKDKEQQLVNRLAGKTKKNDSEDSRIIKVEENLEIRYESSIELYQALSQATNEREYRKIAREHWLAFKKTYKSSLAQYKTQQFVQKFVKENKKYNIYLPDFNQEKQKHLNLDDDEVKQKELMNEDEEIFNMIDKIMTGAVYQKWKGLQDKDI